VLGLITADSKLVWASVHLGALRELWADRLTWHSAVTQLGIESYLVTGYRISRHHASVPEKDIPMRFSRVGRIGMAGGALFVFGLIGCGSGSSSLLYPGYSLAVSAPNPASTTAGNTSTSTITLAPLGGYSGNVTLSCVAITGANAPTCSSFSPNPVAVSGNGTSTMTVSTTINTPGGNYRIAVTGRDANNLAPTNGAQSLTLTAAAVIQHVVVIFQENRTPDNLFQDSVLVGRGADIAQQGMNSSGQTITLAPIDLGTVGSNPQNYDLSHAHSAFVFMYDGGKMDGADKIACSPLASCNEHTNPQFMYVMQSDVAPYFALAEQYTFGDRMFQTNQGPSFPAHQFIYGGTSAPTESSPLFAAENPSGASSGCISVPNTTVSMIDAAGSESAQPPQYPCFEHQTLSDLLDAKTVTWRYYTPSVGSVFTAPGAIRHICKPAAVSGTLTCTGPEWSGSVVIPQTQVLTDIANGDLAQVSWVIPDGTYSDHPLSNDGSGPSWVASIVNAVGNSPYWANTAILITWDDWGGWYDHVAPKVINDGVSWGSGYVYGFRVPLIVVSAYAKAKYISHTTHDFGSILKYIETTFSLNSLGYADAYADDLSDCFNMTESPISFQTIPAPIGPRQFLERKGPAVDPDDD
jgi:phospholipase C